MQTEYIIENPGNRRLVIFFTGWSTDYHIGSMLDLPSGYDLLICWDYRRPGWSKLTKQYDETLICAWSFGIPVAEELYPEISKDQNVTGTFAINGSRTPVNDSTGIPECIFTQTIQNLDEKNLHKFRIRIAGGVRKFKEYEKYLISDRGVEDLKEELAHFGNSINKEEKNILWDCVFISSDDKIFPVENLTRSWKDTPIVFLKDESHLPDFSKIFNQTIKDKEAIGKNFRRSQTSYNNNAIVQNTLSRQLVDLLVKMGKEFDSVLELGSGSEYLSRLIRTTFNPKKFLLMDLSPLYSMEDAEYLEGDIETAIKKLPEDSFELVVSGSSMQWFHSPSGILSRIYSILEKEGIFILTTYLSDTFKEIRELTGKGLLYYTEDQWILLAERTGFEVLDSITDVIELQFDSVKEIFDHIRATGVNSSTGKHKSIKEMRELISGYPNENGKFRLSYHTIILILKKN